MLTVTCCMNRSVDDRLWLFLLLGLLSMRFGDRGFGASSLLEFSRRSLISSTNASMRLELAGTLNVDFDLAE